MRATSRARKDDGIVASCRELKPQSAAQTLAGAILAIRKLQPGNESRKQERERERDSNSVCATVTSSKNDVSGTLTSIFRGDSS